MHATTYKPNLINGLPKSIKKGIKYINVWPMNNSKLVQVFLPLAKNAAVKVIKVTTKYMAKSQ